MQTLELIGTALGGGVIGQVFTQLVTLPAARRKGKVDEAQIVANISAQLRQELFQKYEERGKTISKLRRVIISLTNFIDKLLPRILGLTSYEMDKFREAVMEARLAGLAAEI
jgi:hypothetical protein